MEQKQIKEEKIEKKRSIMKSICIKVESKESQFYMKVDLQNIEDANNNLRNEMK